MHILWSGLPRSALPQFPHLLTQPLPEEVLEENFQTHKVKASPLSCAPSHASMCVGDQEILDLSQTNTPLRLRPQMMTIPAEPELGTVFILLAPENPAKSRHPCWALPASHPKSRS